MLSNSTFIDDRSKFNKIPGIFKCTHKGCKICRLYLQECNSFVTANGTNWVVRCHITCNSKNVLYYLVCSFCELKGDLTSYIGKTDCTRDRINNHITGCRHGNTTDQFDNHVYNCSEARNIPLLEPLFKLYFFMALSDYNKLRNYETKLHAEGHDTMNRSK